MKSEFPRIPLPQDATLLKNLALLGKELIALHLLDKTHPKLKKPEIVFCGKGNNHVSYIGAKIELNET